MSFLHHFTTLVFIIIYLFCAYVLRWIIYPFELNILAEPRWFFRLRRRTRRWYWRQLERPMFANLMHIVGILFALGCFVWTLFLLSY